MSTVFLSTLVSWVQALLVSDCHMASCLGEMLRILEHFLLLQLQIVIVLHLWSLIGWRRSASSAVVGRPLVGGVERFGGGGGLIDWHLVVRGGEGEVCG